MEKTIKYESFKTITASIHDFIREFKSVVFEKKEVENQDMSTLIALSPFLTNQESNSDVEKKNQEIFKRKVRLK